jgi:metallo-beta-lactamase family protein
MVDRRQQPECTLEFCGAARQVTGSCYLITLPGTRFLVDCGMYQGRVEDEEHNQAPFRFEPRDIDFVVLTHAHIDHSGLLPRLWREGFRGPVYATEATLDLLGILLPDSAFLQQSEFERRRRHGRPAREPLYSLQDVEGLLKLGRSVDYGTPCTPARGVRLRMNDAGHILGSAIVELWLDIDGRERKLVVSGDLGQPGRPLVRDPTPVAEADLLLCESTYGNRDHRSMPATIEELVATVNRTLYEKKGNVLVPAFAVGRTQELLYWFHELSRQGRFRDLEIYIDSPMATAVTRLTARHPELLDEESRRLATAPPAPGRPRVRFLETASDSMRLNDRDGGAIIIAASGMCEGGRIRHHLKHHLPSPRTTVLITGFQAQGTLGRRIVDGAKSVRIHGDEVEVRAEVATLGGFSAHADQSALTAWLRAFERPPARVCLVHGEEDVQRTFAAHLKRALGWEVDVPAAFSRVDLRAL